jgi:ribosomal protein S18 acetylase RimI-like enzyme
MNPQIRAARRDEVDAVLSLWRRADAEPSATDDPEGVRHLLAHDAHALLVAELDGDIVGTVIAAWDGWRANFYRLAVLPEHRRHGIARALVRHAERELRRRGAIRLSAIVVEGHHDAAGFWNAAGYERQSRRLRFVRNLP